MLMCLICKCLFYSRENESLHNWHDKEGKTRIWEETGYSTGGVEENAGWAEEAC